MKNPKQFWVWVGVVVVVIVVVLIFVWKPSSKPVATGPTPVYAPQGQLVPQFPTSLILDNAAAISGSYSIGYSSSTNQYTAEFNSSSSMASLYTAYNTYLSGNGWTLTGTLITHPSFEELSASQANAQTQVVISSVGTGSQVTISYVTK